MCSIDAVIDLLPIEPASKNFCELKLLNSPDEGAVVGGGAIEQDCNFSVSGMYCYFYDYSSPNFGENKKEGEIVKVGYLILDRPISCNHHNIKAVKMLWDDKGALEELSTEVRIGDQIVLKGAVSGQLLPSHYLRMLIYVKEGSFL